MDSYFVVATYQGHTYIREMAYTDNTIYADTVLTNFNTRAEAEAYRDSVYESVWDEYHRPPCYFCGELTEIHQQGDVCFRCLQQPEDV